jgi:DNA-binding NarL/FixJ family response regulator
MNERITCLVADDHPGMVRAVCDILRQHGMEVAAEATDGGDALAKAEETQPAVAVLDLRMPHLSGIDVARRLARTSPGTAVVLYTAYGERALLTEALDAGARGFVQKESALSELVRAIEVVAAGGTYVDPQLAAFLLAPRHAGHLPSLSKREREVLRLLADGKNYERIGELLFISPETVRAHVRKAMDKLDADTRTQAVAEALRQSLIS